MGNRTAKLFLFVFLTIFARSSFADNCYDAMGNVTGGDCGDESAESAAPAQPATRAPTTVQRSAASAQQNSKPKATSAARASSTVSGGNCESGEVPFSKLDYVEINFATRLSQRGGSCKTVSASNDNQAAALCRGGYIINPGNPQYTGDSSHGTLSSNNLGYYFCITGGADFNKERMCNEMKSTHPQLSVTFQKIGNDGNCMCGDAKSMRKVDCAQVDLEALSGSSPECDPKKGTWKSTGGRDAYDTCVCENGGTANVSQNQCGTQTADTKTPATQTGVSDAMRRCVDKYVNQANQCVTDASAAKTTCDQANKDNKEVDQASQIPGQVANQFIAAKSGSGMLSECMKAGVIANGSKLALDQLKSTCDQNYEACNQNCGDEKVQAYQAECGVAPVLNLSMDDMETIGQPSKATNPDLKYYRENLNKIQQLQNQGTPVCKTDAAKNKSILGSVLNDLGKSLLTAQQCACRAAATAYGTSASTCDATPTAAQCAADPTLAGCPATMAIDICTQGSPNYSSQGCACQTNPKASGCPGYAASTGGLSGFAGPNVGNSTGSGGATFGAGNTGGAGDAGGLDISGNRASDVASGNKTPGATAGFNSGGGGGGGGGLGGAPTGGGDPAAAAGDGEGDGKNSGGAFGLAKSIMGSLFGTNPAKTAAGTASKTAPNLNKFRPAGLRGVAGSDYGGKNMEIWHMMHNVYDDTQSSFLSGP